MDFAAIGSILAPAVRPHGSQHLPAAKRWIGARGPSGTIGSGEPALSGTSIGDRRPAYI
jgi:hypothetical protein